TSNAIDTASGVSRLTSLTFRRGKRGAPMNLSVLSAIASVALEVVERFLACCTAPKRVARARPELAGEMGVLGAGARAGSRLVSEQQPTPAAGLGWGDAILAQLAPAILGQPVGGPGGRQHRADGSLGDTDAQQSDLDLQGDQVHGRTAGVRGRYRHLDTSILDVDAAQNPEIGNGQDRDLR